MGNRLSRESNVERLGAVIDYNSKIWKNEAERKEWINSVISVLANNKPWTSCNYDYRLVYTKNSEQGFVAQLLAVNNPDGVIKTKIDPAREGKDHVEAFKLLKRHIEIRMNELLADVPDAIPSTPKTLSAATMQSSTAGTLPSIEGRDAPPSYEQGVHDDAAIRSTKR